VANRLNRSKIDELWAAYQVHGSIHEVAKKCGIHHRTVERYLRLERWDERLEEIRAKAQKKADYTLAQAMTDSLKLVRAYKQKMSDAISNKLVSAEDVTGSELERIIKPGYRDISPV
jgi:IS30 family transposase